MARGSIPYQVPAVPQELFFAFNDIYLHLKALNKDLLALEGGNPGGGIGGHVIQDEGVSVPQRGILNFIGAGVSVADAGTKTAVTITASSGNSYFPQGW